MSSKDQIIKLKEELYSAEIIYAWNYEGAGLKYNNLFNWGYSVFIYWFTYLVISLVCF